MFSVEKFYQDAHSGDIVDAEQLCQYLNGFSNVVIWGAGNLGIAVGKKLQKMGIHINAYWDVQYEKIKERNGVEVWKTYSGDFEPSETVIIFCIANVPVSPKLYKQLIDLGWNNVILGLALLEGLICPFSKNTELDTAVCNSMGMCTVCNCQRLSNIMKYQVVKGKNINEEDVLAFDRIHFIINNFCNLKCTHCFMYMNSYPPERKRNVDIDIMKRDINVLFDVIDSFGVVNVFGGEPFLHSQLGEIVSEILKRKNFGSVIVNTNGLAKMKNEQLVALQDKRVRLAFSNYLASLNDIQKEKLDENLNLVKRYDIIVGMQNELPTWNISSTLSKNDCTEEEMKQYKELCGVKFLYVHNGKVFPCAMCLSINDLGVEDYPTDYVNLEKCKDVEEVRSKIKEMLHKEYYGACRHCEHSDHNIGITTVAGEQGFDERYALPKHE